MIRLVSIFTGALLIGVVAGSLLRPAQRATDGIEKRSLDSSATNSFYQNSLDAKESVITELTEENRRLTDYIAKLEDKASEAVNQITTMDEVFDIADDSPAMNADAETRRRRRNWDPEDEEGRARRQEFVNRMRSNMLDVWDKEWENASPESQERISAIAQYQQDLMDIRGEIRGAETDEDRQLIFEEMNAVRDALNQTLKAEQNAKLNALAEKYGIRDEADINAFVRETQETISSPAFQSNTSRGAGAFGGGRGGFGGFRGTGSRGGFGTGSTPNRQQGER
jgi:hypothetical protein